MKIIEIDDISVSQRLQRVVDCISVTTGWPLAHRK